MEKVVVLHTATLLLLILVGSFCEPELPNEPNKVVISRWRGHRRCFQSCAPVTALPH